MHAVETNLAPRAIGAYSQANVAGDFVFISGQIPLVPETMEMVSGSIDRQVLQVVSNLRAVCHAAGGSLASVVKLTVYLIDISHVSYVNEVITQLFSEPYPARSVIEVSALPKGALVEMDAIMTKLLVS